MDSWFLAPTDVLPLQDSGVLDSVRLKVDVLLFTREGNVTVVEQSDEDRPTEDVTESGKDKKWHERSGRNARIQHYCREHLGRA